MNIVYTVYIELTVIYVDIDTVSWRKKENRNKRRENILYGKNKGKMYIPICVLCLYSWNKYIIIISINK